MTLVGRGILHRPLVLPCHMTADQAAGGCTQYTMVACIMTGDAADDGALDAALGVGRYRGCCKCQRQRESGEECFHVGRSRSLCQSTPRNFVPPANVGRAGNKSRHGGKTRRTVEIRRVG
jgi:hypothetical protein